MDSKPIFLAIICVLALVLQSAGCAQEPKEQPTIEPDKIAAIIADTYIADAAVTGAYGTIRDSMHAYYYQQVFTLHGVSREDYQKNMAIYSKSMVQMDTIMQMALRKLEHKN